MYGLVTCAAFGLGALMIVAFVRIFGRHADRPIEATVPEPVLSETA